MEVYSCLDCFVAACDVGCQGQMCYKETQWYDGKHNQELEQETIKGTLTSE